MKKLPVIDIAPLYDVNHPDYADICNQIDQACREWGFFYISGYKPNEPYRVCRRVNILRDYPDEKTKLYPRN